MPDAALDVSGLSLVRGAVRLGPITFSLPGSGCYWLTGDSGAGKSLLLESLAGFHAEACGSIRVEDEQGWREVGEFAPERRSIALMPQRWRLFPHWSVARNLRFAARLGSAPPERLRRLADRLDVARLLDRPSRALSGGETQRVALIQTLLAPARILLLDEPLSAVDAALQSTVLDLLHEEASANGRICIVAAHRALEGHPMQGMIRIERGQLISPAGAPIRDQAEILIPAKLRAGRLV